MLHVDIDKTLKKVKKGDFDKTTILILNKTGIDNIDKHIKRCYLAYKNIAFNDFYFIIDKEYKYLLNAKNVTNAVNILDYWVVKPSGCSKWTTDNNRNIIKSPKYYINYISVESIKTLIALYGDSLNSLLSLGKYNPDKNKVISHNVNDIKFIDMDNYIGLSIPMLMISIVLIIVGIAIYYGSYNNDGRILTTIGTCLYITYFFIINTKSINFFNKIFKFIKKII